MDRELIERNEMIRKVLIANRGEIAIRIASHACARWESQLSRCSRNRIGMLCTCGRQTKRRKSAVTWTQQKSCVLQKTPAPTPSTRVTDFFQRMPRFRRPAKKAGIIFIGPRPETIRSMGDKLRIETRDGKGRRSRCAGLGRRPAVFGISGPRESRRRRRRQRHAARE